MTLVNEIALAVQPYCFDGRDTSLKAAQAAIDVVERRLFDGDFIDMIMDNVDPDNPNSYQAVIRWAWQQVKKGM